LLAALRRHGQPVERTARGERMVLATRCPDGKAVCRLASTVVGAARSSARRPAAPVVVRRIDSGFMVAFPAIVALPVRVVG
jgi:hypothetical protein